MGHHSGKVFHAAAIVADSHALVRAGLVEVLRRRFSFQLVREASSFGEVIELIYSSPKVEFVSIDLELPGMVGAASLIAVRTARPLVRLAVFSESVRRDDVLSALGAGVHGFIPKTFQVSQVADALRTVLGGNIFVPPALADPVGDWLPAEIAPPDPRTRGLAGLSRRQTDVLNILALGKTNREISEEMHLAEGTVKVHVQAILRALAVKNRASAVAAIAQFQKAASSV